MENHRAKLHETDVEKWGSFLSPITVINVSNTSYQCNRQIFMIKITHKLRDLYQTKNESELSNYLGLYLYENQIDLNAHDYFVKLSTISGKDIAYDDDTCIEWDTMNTNIKKLIIRSVYELSTYLLRSDRIGLYMSDLNTKYLVFREWIDFDITEEFRCFVYDKKLIAISQYEYGTELPKSMQVPESIVSHIKFFVDQVIGLIPFNNVVLDVALKFSNMNVYFIEFNPFGLESDTDAGLYDWVHDNHILCPIDSNTVNRIDIRLFDMAYIERKFQI